MIVSSQDFYSLIRESKLWDFAIGDSSEKVLKQLGKADEVEEYSTGISYWHYSFLRFAFEKEKIKGLDILDNGDFHIYFDQLDVHFDFGISLSKLITFLFSSNLEWLIEMKWSNSDFLILRVEANCKIYYDLYKDRIFKIENYVS